MKKLLSTITAVSLLAGMATGLTANAKGLFDPMKSMFDTTKVMFGTTLFAEGDAASDKATPTPDPTGKPTEKPTAAPTAKPTEKPTEKPTAAPTAKPTEQPTAVPTEKPTAEPTEKPTERPTAVPTEKPTETPTAKPTAEPTEQPTQWPDIVKSISLNKQLIKLKKGDTFQLTITDVEPQGAELGSVYWNSTNTGSVAVSSNGLVTAVAEGDSTVSAISSNGKVAADCYVSVEEDDGIISLSTTEGVAQVVVTRMGLSTELIPGTNKLEAGVYTVDAKAAENYELNDYVQTLTLGVGETAPLSIIAHRTSYKVTLPKVDGINIYAINGSTENVNPGGSYNFVVTVADGVNASDLVIKANGEALTKNGDSYSITNINSDVAITIEGVSKVSGDTTLKSVKVNGKTATLGNDDVYSVTIPHDDVVNASDIEVEVNDYKTSYTITSLDGVFTITVKAEDGTIKAYKLSIVNAEATDLDTLKNLIMSENFDDISQTSSGSYISQDSERDIVDSRIRKLASKHNNVSVYVENGDTKAPVKGTLQHPSSEDGYYEYKVTVASGDDQRTVTVRIWIDGYDYLIPASNISSTYTSITVKGVPDDAEVALYTRQGGKLRNWTSPNWNNVVTFSNLSSGESYGIKIREYGSSEIPSGSTFISTVKTSGRNGPSSYHTVYFYEGDHGTILSGKSKQTVGNTRVAEYPTVKADDGYIFKGWSANGVLIENPNTYYIRSNTSFTALYEKSANYSRTAETTTAKSVTPTENTSSSRKDTASYVFSDVPSNSWFYDNVTSICKKGFMNGTTDSSFEPNTQLTRAMLVTILYRYASEPQIYLNLSFNDVPTDTWYSNAVAWAAEAGIVEGDDGRFSPNDYVTREQFAAIIYRYSQAFGYDTSAAGNIIKFADSAKISDWAQAPLIWTTGAGIIDGKDGNMLDPKGGATRAEAATIINRFDTFIDG